ncbi:MAG: hypothetical protein O3C28_18275 [Proteobacteria bacterium]|nr:hypothetical protein [Pseudomonadota bacterium]
MKFRIIRRSLLIRIAFVCAFSAAYCSASFAEQRYEVVPLNPGFEFGSEKALILDTVAGHMWIWVESPAVGQREGGRYVIYQGQLEPGRKMGDIIVEQHWAPDQELPKKKYFSPAGIHRRFLRAVQQRCLLSEKP